MPERDTLRDPEAEYDDARLSEDRDILRALAQAHPGDRQPDRVAAIASMARLVLHVDEVVAGIERDREEVRRRIAESAGERIGGRRALSEREMDEAQGATVDLSERRAETSE